MKITNKEGAFPLSPKGNSLHAQRIMKRTPIRRISKKREQVIKDEAKIRVDLLDKCQGLCMACGELPDWRGLSLHHKKFKSRGGDNSEGNVTLVCGRCHNKYHGILE